jgi:hypothetical protein
MDESGAMRGRKAGKRRKNVLFLKEAFDGHGRVSSSGACSHLLAGSLAGLSDHYFPMRDWNT